MRYQLSPLDADVTRIESTGLPRMIDSSPQRLAKGIGSAMTILGPVFALKHIADMPIALRANRSFSGSRFSGWYKCADGSVVIAANTPSQAEARLIAPKRCGLWATPQVRDGRNHPDIARLVQENLLIAIRSKQDDGWTLPLNGAHVPVDKVRSLPEILVMS